MKRLAVLCSLCRDFATLAAAPMTPLERERLLEHFQMTESWLVSELAGLSDAQLNWRAVGRKVEHRRGGRAPGYRRAAVLGPGEAVDGEARRGRVQAEGDRRGHSLVRNRPHAAEQDRRGAHAARRVQDGGRGVRSVSQIARRDGDLREVVAGGPARAGAFSPATWTSTNGCS